MKLIEALSATVLFLLPAAITPAFAQRGHEEEKQPQQKQQQEARPAQQPKQAQQQQQDPYSMATLQQQQQQVLNAQQAALYGNGNDHGDHQHQNHHQHQGMSHHGQSASISNGYPSSLSPVSVSGAPTIGGLLAPSNARGQHSRAVSLPVFAQQLQVSNGSFSNGNGHRERT